MATIQTTIEIKEGDGLHARPASELAALAKTFKSDITLGFASKEANARSIISMLALGLKKGSVINLKADGEDSEEAIQEVIKFFENIH
ncbi:HPr family phosphocarrier protein [uncultured Dysgonomonas sp.]|uniref:Phosphocarrier protein HPr n=1 Tax=uncultured Dysgonomonas sp. TaxID=206096 RepID=A0A212ITX5_9BACT|nr:HPr family phosphocarrier protein [uncultured Dysgonomonas sp.]SBV90641.1 Phosphotransferase system, phosphocarrier protein HPr [uncultured Dysgonomonas sp.]